LCVATQAFSEALRQALDAPQPDPQALHPALAGRFGKDVFQSNIDTMFERVAPKIAVN
jgi:hypothetical protein